MTIKDNALFTENTLLGFSLHVLQVTAVSLSLPSQTAC